MTLHQLSLYGLGFQTKVINLLLNDLKFLKRIYDIINPDYFDSPANKWIVTQIIEYYKKYRINPNLEFLKIELKKVENDILQLAITEQLRESFSLTLDDKKYIDEEFSSFCINQQLKAALLESVDLLQAGEFDGIKDLMNKALQAGKDKTLGHEYKKDIESRYKENLRNVVPTPWPQINDLTQGGVGGGDLILIFGNPGGGKSWMLVAMGAYAASLGFKVNHYTLELSETYTGLRYDAYFSQIPVDQVSSNKDQVNEIINKIKGNIVIKEFPMHKASMATIEAHYSQCCDEGQEPELILIDYLDLLKAPRSRKDRKEEIDDNYAAAKGWAREINKPVISPSQVNRAGAKDEVIEGDKAAGSYDKMMIADLSMSLSRHKKDKVKGTGRLHIMKNRFGGDGMTFNVDVDTTIGHIEITSEFEEDETPKVTEPLNKRALSSKFDDFFN